MQSHTSVFTTSTFTVFQSLSQLNACLKLGAVPGTVNLLLYIPPTCRLHLPGRYYPVHMTNEWMISSLPRWGTVFGTGCIVLEPMIFSLHTRLLFQRVVIPWARMPCASYSTFAHSLVLLLWAAAMLISQCANWGFEKCLLQCQAHCTGQSPLHIRDATCAYLILPD